MLKKPKFTYRKKKNTKDMTSVDKVAKEVFFMAKQSPDLRPTDHEFHSRPGR